MKRPPPQGRGNEEWRSRFITPSPHATAPVFKYKARGIKRTLPLKYSTNLSMEAKGQWARPLPFEGGGLKESTYRKWLRHPSLPGFGCSLSTRSGERGGEGMTVLSHPLLREPPAPAQAFLCPPAQVRGCGRNCVGIQGLYLFLLPFLGAAWAKPFPPRLGRQPHTGKVEPLDGTIRVVTANHLSI